MNDEMNYTQTGLVPQIQFFYFCPAIPCNDVIACLNKDTEDS